MADRQCKHGDATQCQGPLYASQYDVTWESTTELSNWLSALIDNPFEKVKMTDVSLAAAARPGYAMYTVDRVQTLQNGAWVEATEGVVVTVPS